MKIKMKKHWPLIARIVISGLFLLSAIAKLFPVWAFEKQLVDLGMVNWCTAPYFSRLIIALELAIAIGILQKHFLKRFVIPVTAFLLIAFCIHLGIQMIQHGAMNGNCGCFGQLIPMTPLEAFIKNVLTLVLLYYVYRKSDDKPKGENRVTIILLIYFISAFLTFAVFPFCPCGKSTSDNTTNNFVPPIDTTNTVQLDTPQQQNITAVKTDTANKKKLPDSLKTTKPIVAAPPKVISKFSVYNLFNGQKADLDQGKKIVCLFVPGCDHCRDAAKELVGLSKKHKLPPVYILFMNEEKFKIPEFYAETKIKCPYHLIDDIPAFFKLLGNKATTPGIVYLWNGNIIRNYQGVEDEKFSPEDMIKAIESDEMPKP
jgi:hypothetical protein